MEAGWACASLPKDTFGRGYTDDDARTVVEEFERAGAPLGEAYYFANFLAISLIARYSTNETLLGEVLRGLLLGDYLTCVLYSEPGAGSDLAAVQTFAERDGEVWRVTGQKVWSSLAEEASHGILLARTDWSVPKHKGITVFLLPMEQDAVDVRPIRQITGKSSFNEVFLNDAVVEDTHRIGEVNDGWNVLQTALAVERMVMGTGITHGRAGVQDLEKISMSELIGVTRDIGFSTNLSHLRQSVARLHSTMRIIEWNGERAAGMSDPKTASIVKLAKSEYLHGLARVYSTVIGAESLMTGDDAVESRHANMASMDAFQLSISGGSDQIQRNLIADRILGLPREPAVDRDVPFRDVRKAEGFRRYG